MNRTSRLRIAAAIVAGALVAWTSAYGEESKPVFLRKQPKEVYEALAVPIQPAPKLDGVLDDACWKDAPAIGAFRVVGRDAFAEKQTALWAGFGNDAIYLAVACEDDEIMATSGPRDSDVAWTMDAIEMFLCPKRDNEVWFHFIFNAVGARYDDIEGTKRNPAWTPETDWEVAIRKQPWGWTAEVRIPCATLNLADPPGRGDVWKMKCIRTDLSKKGKIQSSWTRVAGAFDADLLCVGDLIFESRNLLANPFVSPRPACAASGAAGRRDGGGDDLPDWKVAAGKGSVRRITAEGEPAALFHWEPESAKIYWSNFGFGGRAGYKAAPYDGIFRFTAKARLRSGGGYFRWYIGEEKEPYISVPIVPSVNFREYELQHAFKRGQAITAPEFHASGTGEVEIKDAVFKLDDRVTKKAGLKCLTANAPPELKEFNLSVSGCYTYCSPGADAAEFPYMTPHFGGPPTVVAFNDEKYRGSDGHRVGGWIPFSEGYLTDGLMGTRVTWGQFFPPVTGYDLVFDLKDDYLIDEVEVISGTPSLLNGSLFLKSSNDSRFVMTRTATDLVRYNQSGYPGNAIINFTDVQAGARWVRVNAAINHDGLSEIRIWGRPFKQGESHPQKIPYRQNEGKEVVAKPVELAGLPETLVFPLPQELEKKTGAISIGPATKIAISGAADHHSQGDSVHNERARMTAETLQEALFVRTGLKLAITETTTPGAIQIREDPGVTEKAEGYLLEVNSSGITITGKDAVGAFYGAQSLAQIVAPDGKSGWKIPCLRIRDWPATPIRYVSGGQPVSPDLIRALARFKINYYAPVQTTVSPENRALAGKYCVKLVPNVQFNLAWGADPEAFTERAAGESLSGIGTSRRNPCPSHPGVWEAYFKQMDALIEASNSDLVNINADEMYMEQAGARWNVCARCRARNLSGQELWVEALKKIQGHLHERGRKLLMIDSILGYKGISHPGDAANDWSKIPDLLPPAVKKDMVVYLWHWSSPVYAALVRNGITLLRWNNATTFPKEHGFPGPYSGFFLDQADGAMDVAQVVAMAQLCWSPQQSNGGGADLPAATSAAQAGADRFLELTVAAVPMWAECSANKLPPSRQSGRGSFSIDLGNSANRSRRDDAPCDGRGWVDLGDLCDLRALQAGPRVLGGIPFTILDEEKNHGYSAAMVVNRGALDRQLPCRLDIPVGRKAASLCFLHALSRRAGWNYLKKEELCGYYHVVYDDGTYDPFEIKYAINAANWDGKNTRWNYSPTGLALARATLAWRGQTRSGQTAALYATEWINPKPDALIRKIVFASPQLKTGVSPILLAVTGFEPVAGDVEDSTVDRLTRLRPVSVLEEPALPGKPVDLSDGVIESKRLYVTKDGVRVSTASPFLEGDIWGEDSEGGVAHVVWDNNRGIKCANSAAEVVIELPANRPLCGVGVIGMYRNEHYNNDFPPSLIDYAVEASPDGKAWEKIADVIGHIPEEEGLRVHAFAPRSLKAIRVSARNNPHSYHMNSRGGQLAFVQLYEAPQIASCQSFHQKP
ncbi:MAG: hypothetical protein HY360_21040 [Verrucomicrobia bacterium]|nr:hypothetical protein [Verrucomicrobiota bacterium]